jgi:VIT1/CCC1 family predicted Fe2+/Mn2+ transporter
MGACPSVIPFACTDNPLAAFIAAAVLCTVASFLVGAFICTVTKQNPWATGALNSVRAIVGGALAWGITEGYKLARH